jgi:hypothetical protein
MDNPINSIKLFGMENDVINFGNTLGINNSIIIKNCSNLKIIIGSKINIVLIEKSTNIHIFVYKLINGMEITSCQSIKISPVYLSNSIDYDFIPSINMHKSIVYLIGNINQFANVKLIYSQSELHQFEWF